jgi:hypothetical protein
MLKKLSKIPLHQKFDDNAPTRVLQIVEDDARGVFFPRLISL